LNALRWITSQKSSGIRKSVYTDNMSSPTNNFQLRVINNNRRYVPKICEKGH